MQRRAEFDRPSVEDKVEVLFFNPDVSNAEPPSKEQWEKAVFPEDHVASLQEAQPDFLAQPQSDPVWMN